MTFPVKISKRNARGALRYHKTIKNPEFLHYGSTILNGKKAGRPSKAEIEAKKAATEDLAREIDQMEEI